MNIMKMPFLCLYSMPWQGHKDVTIDRFDGRAHLDFIPEYKAPIAGEDEAAAEPGDLTPKERRELVYERYRILVQNDFLKSELLDSLMTLDTSTTLL